MYPAARDFRAGQAIFPEEYFVYFKGKWRGAARKDPLSGCVGRFQLHPIQKRRCGDPQRLECLIQSIYLAIYSGASAASPAMVRVKATLFSAEKTLHQSRKFSVSFGSLLCASLYRLSMKICVMSKFPACRPLIKPRRNGYRRMRNP